MFRSQQQLICGPPKRHVRIATELDVPNLVALIDKVNSCARRETHFRKRKGVVNSLFITSAFTMEGKTLPDRSSKMATTIVGYLRDNLGIDGDFMKEYRSLSAENKQDLRDYAAKECEVLGIELKASEAPKS